MNTHRSRNAHKGTLLLLVLLAFVAWGTPRQAQAYSISYSYMLLTGYDENNPKDALRPPPSLHQLVITDGYCVFIHQGAFDRVCFEGGPGFRFEPFAFDVHAQVTFHALWFKPVIYGLFVNTGIFATAYPNFQAGLRAAVGFHLYFLAPAVEFQLSVDERGRADARFYLQIALVIPTATVNFALGNFGF